MQGKIMKGIGGFYYVYGKDHGIYECRAKGIFRNQKQKPMVGDNVEIDILDEDNKIGSMTAILPRNNMLIRPAVANVEQAMMIFAMTKPAPNLNLLDRFIILMQRQHVDTVICFNKTDLSDADDIRTLRSIYRDCGLKMVFISVENHEGIDQVFRLLQGKTTVLAGPSGVGKSSLINALSPNANAKTNTVSEKIDRGRHTTRHSEIISISDGTYIMDTPGFTSLDIDDIKKEELADYFAEIKTYAKSCRFAGCSHIYERTIDCGVKQALEDKMIHRTRYDSYVMLYEELKHKREWK